MGCVAQKPQTEDQVVKQIKVTQHAVLEDAITTYEISELYIFKSEDIKSSDKRDFKVISKKTNKHRLAMKIGIPSDINQKKDLDQKLHSYIQLDHNGLEKCYEIFIYDKDYIVIKDYPDGVTLTEYVVKYQLKQSQIAELFQSILQGLNFLHQRQLIHGNLKSDNILIQENKNNPYPKIFQIGISFSQDEWERHNLRSTTADYFCRSPEVLKGRFELASDIWSVGILMYFTLTGIMPFDGPDKQRVKNNIIKGTLDFNNSQWEQLSDCVKQLIKCMLKYMPVQRPAASQCLTGKWFKSYKKTHFGEKEKKLIQNSIERIDMFHTDNKLERAILMILANNSISQKESAKLLKLFSKIDVDNDGVLSKEELQSGFRQIMSEDQARQEVDYIFKQFDLDHHNEIDYREFLTAFSKKKRTIKRSEIQELFKQADHDKNGTLSVYEVKRLLVKVDCTDLEIHQMFTQWDTNNDGQISFEEFYIGVTSMRTDQPDKAKSQVIPTSRSPKSSRNRGQINFDNQHIFN